MEAFYVEINLKKQKWLISKAVDLFSPNYEVSILMGDMSK